MPLGSGEFIGSAKNLYRPIELVGPVLLYMALSPIFSCKLLVPFSKFRHWKLNDCLTLFTCLFLFLFRVLGFSKYPNLLLYHLLLYSNLIFLFNLRNAESMLSFS